MFLRLNEVDEKRAQVAAVVDERRDGEAVC